MLKRIEGSILVHKGMDGVGQQGTAILIASIGSFISIAVSMIGTLSNYISNHFNSKPSQITEFILGAYSWPLYLLIILVMIISVYWIGSYLNRQKELHWYYEINCLLAETIDEYSELLKLNQQTKET